MISLNLKRAAILLAGICLAAINAQAQTPDQNPAETSGPIYTPSEEQNISGVWWTEVYSPEIRLIGGGVLPINEAGRARHAENRAALEADPLSDEARKFCTPDGVPRILASGAISPGWFIPISITAYSLSAGIRARVSGTPHWLL